MRAFRVASLVLLALSAAAPASADATLFVGSTATPSYRPARGLAVGVSLIVVGFELEYASTSEDAGEGAPSLRTGMANVFLQTPVAVFRLRPYVTVGAGGYREVLGADAETNVGVNSGGGVKISLAGPLRARIDYRVIKLAGSPRHGTSRRLYAGLNVQF